MFGYACRETDELMPLPIMLAHKLWPKLADVRRSGHLPYLGPDGKSQVSVEYLDGRPVRVDTVVLSTQHGPRRSSTSPATRSPKRRARRSSTSSSAPSWASA